ncbi:MAG: hypothetical protein AABZ31_09305 [Bdellovibrionota bacterium]
MSAKLVPSREIQFAAKTGFLSKPLWLEFFTKRSKSRNSRIWNSFVQDGYFRRHDSTMLTDVLILANRSIHELQKRGIMAVTKPHLGQFDHDEKAARIILSLEREKAIGEFITEAELKRKHWLWIKASRDGKDAKFPDLTITLPIAAKFQKVAVEVEQSKKSYDRYKKIMSSYAGVKDIDAVIFISNQQSIFNSISRAMKEVNYPSWERPVGFGEMDHWLKDPLTAPIYLSRSTSSIQTWLNEKSEKIVV